MKKLILVLAVLVLASAMPAHAINLGGLEFSFGKPPADSASAKMADVQIVGRSGGRSFIGTGVRSAYAYRLNAANVFNVDLLSIVFVAAGTFEDNEDGKFIGGVGISPVAFFNGKLMTMIGYDIANRNRIRGEMTTLTAVVQF